MSKTDIHRLKEIPQPLCLELIKYKSDKSKEELKHYLANICRASEGGAFKTQTFWFRTSVIFGTICRVRYSLFPGFGFKRFHIKF